MAGDLPGYLPKSTLAGDVMKTTGALLLFFFYCSIGSAQYVLIPYYESDALVTEGFLPFSLQDSDGNYLEFQNVLVTWPCFTMVDQYRPKVFHLYCMEAANPNLTLFFREDGVGIGGVNNMSYQGLNIREVSALPTNPEPPGPVEPDPVFEAGQRLFQSDCLTCHAGGNNIPSSILPLTAAQLQAAFDDSPNGQMNSYGNLYQNLQAEKEALVKYINESFQ